MASLGVLALLAQGLTAPAIAQDSAVTGELERTAGASVREKLQYVDDAIDEQQGAVKAIQKLLEDARRRGDNYTIECVSERVSQIGALAQVSEISQASMKSALDAEQTERADHELRKVAVALTKSRQLLLEARGCDEDSGVALGETRVSVEGDRPGEPKETRPVTVDVMDLGVDPPQQSPFN